MDKLKKILRITAIKIALFLFRGIFFFRSATGIFFSCIKNIFSRAFKILLKLGGKKLILFLYKSYLIVRKFLLEIFLPAKNKFFYPFINKGTIHFLVIFIAAAICLKNLRLRVIQADSIYKTIGSKSVLTTIISEELGELELIEESSNILTDTVNYAQTDYMDTKSFGVRTNSQSVETNISKTQEEEEFHSTRIVSGADALIQPYIISTLETPEERKGIIEYLVQAGDAISSIAEKFGISTNTILWSNDVGFNSIIRPGDNLKILPVSGVLHKVQKGETIGSIAKKYNTVPEKILAHNNLKEMDIIQKGQELIVPDGIKPVVTIARMTANSAIQRIFSAGPSKYAASLGFIWPTVSKRITQYYHLGHHAVDIGGKTGNAIYAIEKGQIIFSGWSSGYGYNVIIDHGGGQKSRYAHFSKFYVKKGDFVSKGEQVGAMGSTGWSTGPHLHLEVLVSGAKVNPLKYIK